MAKKNKTQYDKVNTLLADDVTLTNGKLFANSTVRIDGKFTGEIDVKSSLVIGKNGCVEGNINSDNVLVSGKIQGNICTNGQIHITTTGTVDGDIVCDRIIIDEGAVFTGKCSTNANADLKENKPEDIFSEKNIFKDQMS